MMFPCPDNYNLADHLINVLSTDSRRNTDSFSRIQTIRSGYESSPFYKNVEDDITENEKEIVSVSCY